MESPICNSQTKTVDSPVVIYALSDPANPSLIKYIGKTKAGLKNRLVGHLRDETNKKKMDWFNGMKPLKPLIWPIEVCNSQNWAEREKHWISFFRPIGLFNISEGGSGCVSGMKWTDEQRAAHSRLFKKIGHRPGALNIQRTIERNKRGLSAESRAKISKTLTGRKMPDEQFQKFKSHPSQQIVIRKFRECNEKRKKKVVCVQTGEIFPSIAECGMSIGYHPDKLRQHIKHKWKYKGLNYKIKE